MIARDGDSPDRFGYSVAIEGEPRAGGGVDGTVVIGAPHDVHQGTDSGSAYVFRLTQSPSYGQDADDPPEDPANP